MATGDVYRSKAAEIRAHAAQTSDSQIKAQLNALAESFSRLADQAEKDPNSLLDGFLAPPKEP